MNKALLFDFDGVIVDSFDFCFRITRYNSPELTEQGYRDRFNGNIYESSLNVAAQSKPVMTLDFWPPYVEELNKCSIRSEVKSAIQELHNEYDLFIVSSSISPAISEFLKRNALSGCFKEILGGDLDKRKDYKIDLILKKYGLAPNNCLFVTDTVGDILEAQKCGIQSVAVAWGYHDATNLAKAKPAAIVKDTKELLSTIKTLLD
jgi:phosphoglycolate phosphatase